MASAGPLVVPELPKHFGDQTHVFWSVWTGSPQAEGFSSQTDWERLVLIGHLVEAFYQRPSAALNRAINDGLLKLDDPMAVDHRLPRSDGRPDVFRARESATETAWWSTVPGVDAPPLRDAERFSGETRDWYAVWRDRPKRQCSANWTGSTCSCWLDSWTGSSLARHRRCLGRSQGQRRTGGQPREIGGGSA